MIIVIISKGQIDSCHISFISKEDWFIRFLTYKKDELNLKLKKDFY